MPAERPRTETPASLEWHSSSSAWGSTPGLLWQWSVRGTQLGPWCMVGLTYGSEGLDVIAGAHLRDSGQWGLGGRGVSTSQIPAFPQWLREGQETYELLPHLQRLGVGRASGELSPCRFQGLTLLLAVRRSPGMGGRGILMPLGLWQSWHWSLLPAAPALRAQRSCEGLSSQISLYLEAPISPFIWKPQYHHHLA